MKRFFAELARRQVFRVAAAYAIVGWIVLQVASITAPAMNLPGWATSFVFYVLITGFPIAVLLAWAFELTPEGVRRTEQLSSAPSSPRIMDVGLIGAAVAVVLISVIFLPTIDVDRESSIEPEDQTTRLFDPRDGVPSFSIAVLPLDNLSDERTFEWIADGISEDITSRIASYGLIPVAARNSAFSYKGTSPDVREVGKDLNVRFVLEGSLRPVGEDLRITAQLIDAASGNHIWTSTYTHPLANLAQMQDEVVDAISIEATSAVEAYEQARLEKKPLGELTPFDLFSLAVARAFYPYWSLEGQREAIELAEAAVGKDPDYLFAHGLLAQLYASEYAWSGLESQGLLAKSEQHLKLILERAPRDQWTLNRSALVMSSLRRHEDAFFYASEAVQAYPNWYLNWIVLAGSLASLGRYEEAQEAFHQSRGRSGAQNPEYVGLLGLEARILLGLGDFEGAERVSREQSRFMKDGWPQLRLIIALSHQGKLEEAREQLDAYGNTVEALELGQVENYLQGWSDDTDYIAMNIQGLKLAGME